MSAASNQSSSVLWLMWKLLRWNNMRPYFWNKYERYAISTLPSTSRKDSSSCPDRVSALRRVLPLTKRFVVCCIPSNACYCHHMLLQVNGLCLISRFRHGVRSGLLRDFRRRRVKYPYRCFGAIYRFHLQGSRCHIQRLTFEDGTDRLSRNVGKQLPFYAV